MAEVMPTIGRTMLRDSIQASTTAASAAKMPPRAASCSGVAVASALIAERAADSSRAACDVAGSLAEAVELTLGFR